MVRLLGVVLLLIFALAPGTNGAFSPPLISYAIFDTPTAGGYGSSNTNVRLYTNFKVSGRDLTCANSAANGSSCTVNTAGTYCISISDIRGSGAAGIGIGINTTTHGTNGSQGTGLSGEYIFGSAGGNYGGGMLCLPLSVNDVIRLLSQSVEANGTSVGSRMIITRTF